MDLLFKHGNNPTPFGGIVGITYAAWPPPPPPPVVVPPPAPATPVVVEESKAAPAPAPAPPPPAAPKKTTDEIFFDAGSARLTNIAKAMLDGIALRMKNDLNSTAVITGYTDNSGKEETPTWPSPPSAPRPPRSTSSPGTGSTPTGSDGRQGLLGAGLRQCDAGGTGQEPPRRHCGNTRLRSVSKPDPST